MQHPSCNSIPPSQFSDIQGDWFCTYEDRPEYAVTLGVLAGSFSVNYPRAQLLIASPLDPSTIYPTLPPGSHFIHWRPEIGGWNVKPELLAKALMAGARTAAWIDADIFVSRDFHRILPQSQETLVVCDEARSLTTQNTAEWARRLGRKPGRFLPRQINSAFVRVHASHQALLNAWKNVCHDPAYQAQQKRPFNERDDPFKGDQDILTGLLASEEFDRIPLFQLRAGRDIAHLLGGSGFGPHERLATIWRGQPPFLHAHGYPKPWMATSGNDWLALNPYVCAVRNLGRRLGWHLPWLQLPGGKSRLFNALSFGNPALAGLPFVLKPSR